MSDIVETNGVKIATAVSEDAAPDVHVQTYGCQMNEYDSELVRTLLKKRGFRFTEREPEADVVLINTCAVRETAHTRIHARLGDLVKEKREREGGLVVGLLGCMGQNLKAELLADFPAVDFVCGPDGYRDLPHLIERSRGEGVRGTSVELSEYETYEDVAPTRVEGVNAWIAIMRGCDKFCTFCVVPYTRGRERSRSPEGVVEETRRLVDAGYRQVTLLGQNVNSYQHEATDFADLMERVAAVPGVERIRFTSPHPRDFPVKLLEVIAAHDNICDQIHLPLQAGSDRILRKMNRKYTRERFLSLVDQIREIIPGVAFSTDIICGFPTETDEEYRETVDVIERVDFDSAYIFKYSERKGTIATKLYDDDVPDEVKSERVTSLVAIQREISRRKNLEQVGKTVRVLIEGTSRKDESDWRARSEGNLIAIFRDPTAKVGDFRDVRVTDATPNTFLAELASA